MTSVVTAADKPDVTLTRDQIEAIILYEYLDTEDPNEIFKRITSRFGKEVVSESTVIRRVNILNGLAEDNSRSVTTTGFESCEISLSANAWITRGIGSCAEVVTEYGLGNWVSDQTVISIYFYFQNLTKRLVKPVLYIKCKVPLGFSRIQMTIGRTSREVEVEGDQYQWFKVGQFPIKDSGYVSCDLAGLQKSGTFFADVSHLKIIHKTCAKIKCIASEDRDHIYWSRRGPSVHLCYDSTPTPDKCHEYYYTEVTVPSGYDPIGSFFMAIGFDVGYFGIQVNSSTERRVLFSVWSPQRTDDPKQVLQQNKVQLMAKGEDVECKEFGEEGSGLQTIYRYMWAPGVTYKLLLRGRPDPKQFDHSLYTAWFASESDPTWKLIATLKRPESGRYLKGFHSFVENFEPNSSFQSRKAQFGRQWIRDSHHIWTEVTGAKLTGDSAASGRVRHDFEGGVDSKDGSDRFYLMNCGFFDGSVELMSSFKRRADQREPIIDLGELDQMEADMAVGSGRCLVQ